MLKNGLYKFFVYAYGEYTGGQIRVNTLGLFFHPSTLAFKFC